MGPRMKRTITLRCRCGEVEGQVEGVSPRTVNRVRCYCDDCRAFLYFIERPDLLDAHGGAHIVQVRGSSVRFTRGADSILSMRLSPRGMHRWYTRCCHTPVGNTVSSAIPFAGLAREALEVAASDETALFGPAIGCNARHAIHGTPKDAHPKASVALILKMVRRLARWKIRSIGKTSAYFDRDGQPIVTPRVLTKDERAALRERDAAPARAHNAA
jgi:hypothetical protein